MHDETCPPNGGTGAPGDLLSRTPRRGRFPDPVRPVCACLVLLALAGCAGARISDVVSADTVALPPTEILVDVTTPTRYAVAPASTREVAADLRAGLVKQLAKAGFTTEPLVAGHADRGAAVLHVSIVEADPGNALRRIVVGFGAGQARLQARAELLQVGTSAGPMTAFDTSSNSGYKPGLVVPAGAAIAASSAIPLAIGGGIKLATSFHGGLDKPVQHTATAIVDQLEQYYASVGWSRPVGTKA